MRALAAVPLAAALLALPAPAHAESLKTGTLCDYVPLFQPTLVNLPQVGLVTGSALLIADDTNPTVVHTGHVTCGVQVGVGNYTAAGADAATVSGPDTPEVATSPPSVVTYYADGRDPVYVCTSVVTDEGTWYFDNTGGTWVTSPGAAVCAPAL